MAGRSTGGAAVLLTREWTSARGSESTPSVPNFLQLPSSEAHTARPHATLFAVHAAPCTGCIIPELLAPRPHATASGPFHR